MAWLYAKFGLTKVRVQYLLYQGKGPKHLQRLIDSIITTHQVQPYCCIVEPKYQCRRVVCAVLGRVQPFSHIYLKVLTKNVSSIASHAPSMRSSSQLWSQLMQAKRASMYNALAGSAFRSDGSKSVMRDWNMSGSDIGENTSIEL